MRIFNTQQIRDWDAFTIQQEPIASVDLMERAARAFTEWMLAQYPDNQRPVYVFAGTGNNGGDGLVAARLLFRAFYPVKVWICDFSGKHSPDFEAQLSALPADIPVFRVKNAAGLITSFQTERSDTETHPPIGIDALFGTGLTRPLEGDWGEVIRFLNGLPITRIAIDLPSGLMADGHTSGDCVQAAYTVTFQAPKLAFFFPENARYTGKWTIVDIGLLAEYAAQTPFNYLDHTAARSLPHVRGTFSHKGTYGHALLICGSFGKMGAAVLATRACLRAGAGLVTLHAPLCGHDIIQTAAPEAMYKSDTDVEKWTQVPEIQPYTAIGIGPGIGQDNATADALKGLLQMAGRPLVLDADALNLLALHPEWWRHVPRYAILTPHPKEFERLFGKTANDFERNALQRKKAEELGVFIILKGAYTAIAAPDGACWFNSTGNPGMATGGSGDVLTGILTGLLAQGYTPLEACLLGVYWHGRAGDLAAAAEGEPALIASDLVTWMGKALNAE